MSTNENLVKEYDNLRNEINQKIEKLIENESLACNIY